MSKVVYIKEISESLPVNEWFNIHQFSEATGIHLHNSASRLRKISQVDQLDVRGPSHIREWRMTEEHRLLMLAQSEKNIHKRSQKPRALHERKVAIDLVEDINLAEKLAHKINCDRLLKEVHFI